MRRLLLHLAVALIAFVVGVTAALLFGASAAPHVRTYHYGTFHAAPPPPPKPRSCPNGAALLPALPPAPTAPVPPESPAALKYNKDVRIVVGEGGRVHVITPREEKRAARKF